MLRAALILILWLVASACHAPSQHETGPPLSVRLAYATLQDCSLVHLAIARGFFKDERLTVQARPYPYGKEALQAVLQGDADIATVAETPVMFAALQGERISLIGSIFSSNKNHAVVANRKSGVTRPADLKGRRIGFTPGTTSHIFLSSFLTANRIGMEDFIPVPLTPAQMGEALVSGQVDAISAWSPLRKTIARKLAADALVFHDPDIYTETYLLAGRTSYLDQHQEALRRMLRALLKAEDFATRHPKEAQAIVSAALHLDPGLLAECWKEGSLAVSLDHALLRALEEETRWAAKHHLVSNPHMPNYLEYFDLRPLLSVRPEAVDRQVMQHDLRP